MRKSYLKEIVYTLLCGSVIIMSGCTATSTNGNVNNDQPMQRQSKISVEEAETLKELADVWANALKTRDGKPRYEMMSEQAKEKFKQEQIGRSGEDWNFIIGDSSPWVVDYEINMEGMTATITYLTETSEPAKYSMQETVTFIKEQDTFVVDTYQTIF
ncbi:hypothetical protein DNH61_05510 [Paenibacillus sambharensis]|uniref:DUF4019 domain-containing protein n=1 Tax=Paenibacillus sambharensis TaxID=1803190 RepID=A0A2W1LP13_9BACL|nr:hypothetical protein [Paenibacillus sambharensis]PZD96662.1 hypothetical protein DNH61_05510 [Paenibacillus sambharensis]